jgi:succinate dehydrogenase/fumarate reductase flavoprotein subunit
MFDEEYDFVVVGSGAGALTGAITAHDRKMSTLVVEKTNKVGGTSAVSGGGVWIPNNHVIRRAGTHDDREDSVKYFNASVGPEGPGTAMDRREAYIDSGPDMATFLESAGMRWRAQYPYPDYYSDLPGGKQTGRSLEADAFDMRKLGDWEQRVRADNSIPPLWLFNSEANHFLMSTRTVRGFLTAAKVIGFRTILQKVTRQRIATTGKSLVAQLLKIALDRHIPIWLSSPMRELIIEDGRVVGVIVDQQGQQRRIGARRGVLLASGGFSRNSELRSEYQVGPVDPSWTLVPEGDDGDAFRVTSQLGAEMAQMNLAWWMPTFIDDGGITRFNIWERSMPHGIVVDSTGQRFVSESAPYLEFGAAMEERNKTVGAVPAWQIIDAQHRRNYPFTYMIPGITPQAAIDKGFLVKADTIEELAGKIGIAPTDLRQTVDRFNGFAQTGVDLDFHRGHNDFERHYGDPRVKPNPTLGALSKGPYYAAKLWLGDIGTKGGPLTDPDGRVLRAEGDAIPGLYAVGNAAASVMGNAYPGAGATIGPSMIFAYRAALQAVNTDQESRTAL